MAKKKQQGQLKIGTPVMRSVILLFFAALIITADIFLLTDHDRQFSENENRVLSKAPALTTAGISAGKFMTEEENFINDQFFMRDAWISVKLAIDRLCGKKESNSVYLGNQDYLLEIPVKPVEKSLNRNLNSINAFAEETGLNIVMTLIPGAAWVCDQLLPANAPVEDVGKIISDIRGVLHSGINYADATDALKEHKTEYIYYKSDHHWTSLGAKYAIEFLAPFLKIDNVINDYAVMAVTEDFTGTLGSTSGRFEVKDRIDIYIPIVNFNEEAQEETYSDQKELALSTNLEYVVEYVGSVEKSATIYRSEALEAKDKYQVFMGGNHPLVKIRTNNSNDRNLLLLKDSYANTFIQFLLPYYDTIMTVDPRYYSDDLYKLINENTITDVLILYSENNFVTDNSLFGVLEDTADGE